MHRLEASQTSVCEPKMHSSDVNGWTCVVFTFVSLMNCSSLEAPVQMYRSEHRTNIPYADLADQLHLKGKVCKYNFSAELSL